MWQVFRVSYSLWTISSLELPRMYHQLLNKEYWLGRCSRDLGSLYNGCFRMDTTSASKGNAIIFNQKIPKHTQSSN